jgi:hypothetical protein
MLPHFYGIKNKGLYHSGKIESNSHLGSFFFDKLFYAKNVSLKDSFFTCNLPTYGDSGYPSPCYFGFKNLLLQMCKGNENYLIFYRNMLLSGDENDLCSESFYGLINMVNNQPNYSKSVICLNNCELPFYYWVPSRINFNKNEIEIITDSTKNNPYDNGNIKFIIKGTLDSTFQLENYLSHLKKYEKLAK